MISLLTISLIFLLTSNMNELILVLSTKHTTVTQGSVLEQEGRCLIVLIDLVNFAFSSVSIVFSIKYFIFSIL